ncbi:MAG TPA: sugar phosphate isomerase/epimerase [Enterococcus sp.]|uniref:sugar phosphate isomerase/epimerase family protein n=1 Tax=Enterococcus sp. TaxID=35783 RepID=UPI000ED3D5D8|nr:sugar phosphate isomerase/epimerase [Enterococcus sp.]HCE12585.1 sugar phosphate isomerase/epimerase [Enterococcus sp.]
MTKPKIGVQLWSIQDACKEDFAAALQTVKQAGYDGVEFAGYYDHSAEEIAALLAYHGLAAAASHIPYEALLPDKIQETLAFEQAIGNTRIVIPYASFDTVEKWQDFAQSLKDIAQQVQAVGMTLYYHNHAHEFTEIPDRSMIDLLLKDNPSLRLEADLYWLAFADVDVLPWLTAHRETVGLVHIKDMQAQPKESTEINRGILPIKDYVEAAKALDLPWLIVEQEAFQSYGPLEAITIDYLQLKEIVEEVHQ